MKFRHHKEECIYSGIGELKNISFHTASYSVTYTPMEIPTAIILRKRATDKTILKNRFILEALYGVAAGF